MLRNTADGETYYERALLNEVLSLNAQESTAQLAANGIGNPQ